MILNKVQLNWVITRYARKAHLLLADEANQRGPALCGALPAPDWAIPRTHPLSARKQCFICEGIRDKDKTVIADVSVASVDYDTLAYPESMCPGSPELDHKWMLISSDGHFICPVCDAIGPLADQY